MTLSQTSSWLLCGVDVSMTQSRSFYNSRSRESDRYITSAFPLTAISVNITAVVITFISAVASNSEESVLTAVQLLWVNLYA
jgi:hypothetical protein